MERNVPEYCDFDCPFADFPPAETAGICRTMSAVWCQKLRRLVAKNMPCEWRAAHSGGRRTKRRSAASRSGVGRTGGRTGG